MQSDPIPPDHDWQDERPRLLTTGHDAVIVGVLTAVAWFVLFLLVQRADDADLTMAEAHGDTARIWPVDHPVLSALIVCVVVTIGLRLYLFIRRMEDRR